MNEIGTAKCGHDGQEVGEFLFVAKVDRVEQVSTALLRFPREHVQKPDTRQPTRHEERMLGSAYEGECILRTSKSVVRTAHRPERHCHPAQCGCACVLAIQGVVDRTFFRAVESNALGQLSL